MERGRLALFFLALMAFTRGGKIPSSRDTSLACLLDIPFTLQDNRDFSFTWAEFGISFSCGIPRG